MNENEKVGKGEGEKGSVRARGLQLRVGQELQTVTENELRAAQQHLLEGTATAVDVKLIDAVLSFACKRANGVTAPGINLIEKERVRQIVQLDWNAEHDDGHDDRELASAAQGYVSHYTSRAWTFNNELEMPGIVDGPIVYRLERAPDCWPWPEGYWKPKDPLTDLVKAGALIAAEIDRLLRKSAQSVKSVAAESPAPSTHES
jgi:hypothetical protein